MQDVMGLARAQGMPEGVVIRIVNPANGSTMTLREVDLSAVPASAFEAPEGYAKQAMPFRD